MRITFTPADSWCGNKTRNRRTLPEKDACKYWKCKMRDPQQVGMALDYYKFNWSNARKAKDPAAVIARALVKNGRYEDIAQASAEHYIAVCRSLEIWDKRSTS